MESDQTAKSDQRVGSSKFHLGCAYHQDLPVLDSLESAHQAAADHIRKQHSDREGNVAKNAEVTIQEVTHFTTADANNLQSKSEPQK